MPRRRPTTGSPNRAERVATGLGALAVLTGIAAGLPLMLRYATGIMLPDGWTAPGDLPDALTSPDDGSLFAQAVIAAGWAVWAVFLLLVAWEIVGRVFGRRTTTRVRTPKGLAGLLVAAVAALATSPVNSAQAATVAIVAADSEPRPDDDQSPSEPATQPSHITHLVDRGEGLLDVAEMYNVPWERIAEANYGRVQPDGGMLEPGRTIIYPGWQLRVPVTPAPAATLVATNEEDSPTVCAGEHILNIDGQRYAYVVERDDTLWHIAELCLGDGAEWPQIWELNKNRHFPQVGGTFRHQDTIYPGWDLLLPDDAVPPADAQPAEPPEPAAPEAAPEPSDEPSEPAPAEPTAVPTPSPSRTPAPPAPTPTASPTPAQPADQTHVPDVPNDQPDTPDDDAPGLVTPIAFGSALIAATLAVAAVVAHRRRGAAADPRVGRRGHRPGRRPHHVDNGSVEQRLHTAAQPLDVDRLHAALRLLAFHLARRPPAHLPDIIGAHVEPTGIHLLLASTSEPPEPPWQGNDSQWTLPSGVEIPSQSGSTLAALPTLVTVGSRPGQAGAHAGEHLLLDLERLGCLAVSGDPDVAQDLLRYVASELAMNTWSDDVEVICAGWPPDEADLLVALNPHRVRAAPGPIAEQVAQLRHRVRVAATTLEGVEAADALAGRIHDLAGDSWMPTVLIANNPQPADLDAIADLANDLAHVGRCAVAVVTSGTIPTREDHPDTAHAVTVTTGRELYVPFLDLTLTTAGLPLRELEPLAKVIATARDGIEEPVPPAPETEPWATGTDAAGALLPAAGTGPAVADEPRPPAAAIVEPPVPPPAPAAEAPAVAVAGRDQADPTLDDDLAAWYRPVADRPRIRVLGPVVDAHEVIDTPGEPPKPGRLLLLAEVLVYLAQRGKRGASPTQLDEDLWPGQDVQVTYRRATISRARQWAGRRDDGTPWLAEVHYRLEPGYLLDWHLFRRLRSRGQSRGPDGADDLRAALELVRGVPLANFERIASTTRSPYNWLPTSNIDPDHLVAAIIDTANELAQLYLAAGDTAGARWVVEKAWQADPDRSYDQPWRTILQVHAHGGHLAELETTVHELMRLREAEVEEDLDPATYALLQEILPVDYWNGSRAREPVR